MRKTIAVLLSTIIILSSLSSISAFAVIIEPSNLTPIGSIATNDEAVLTPIDNGSQASLQWSTSLGGINYHKQIIDYANKNALTKIPDKYYNLVVDFCNKCDTKWHSELQGTHAGYNYVAMFKYMWYYTKKISKHNDNDSLASDAKKADKYADDKVGKISSANGIKCYDKTRNNIIKIITKYGPKVSGSQTVKGRCKYIMFGFIMHLIGDIYAHRTFVPESVISQLKKADFYIEGVDTIPAGKKSFDQLKKDIKQGIVSFTAISIVYQKPEKNGNVDTKKYEDKPSLFKNRFLESKEKANDFLDFYGVDYDSDFFIASYYDYIDLENVENYTKESNSK